MEEGRHHEAAEGCVEPDGGERVGTVLGYLETQTHVHGDHDDGVDDGEDLRHPDLVVRLEETTGESEDRHQDRVEDQGFGVGQSEGHVEGSDEHEKDAARPDHGSDEVEKLVADVEVGNVVVVLYDNFVVLYSVGYFQMKAMVGLTIAKKKAGVMSH